MFKYFCEPTVNETPVCFVVSCKLCRFNIYLCNFMFPTFLIKIMLVSVKIQFTIVFYKWESIIITRNVKRIIKLLAIFEKKVVPLFCSRK